MKKSSQNITDAFDRFIRWCAEEAPNQSVIKSRWSRRFWMIDSFGQAFLWNDQLIHLYQRLPSNQSVVLEQRRTALEWPIHSVVSIRAPPNSSVRLMGLRVIHTMATFHNSSDSCNRCIRKGPNQLVKKNFQHVGATASFFDWGYKYLSP